MWSVTFWTSSGEATTKLEGVKSFVTGLVLRNSFPQFCKDVRDDDIGTVLKTKRLRRFLPCRLGSHNHAV